MLNIEKCMFVMNSGIANGDRVIAGDLVMDCSYSVWGKSVFRVINVRQWGNLSIALCSLISKPQTMGNRVNLLVDRLRIVDSTRRPLRNIRLDTLKKMLRNGNKEAKREFLMRVHNEKRRNEI